MPSKIFLATSFSQQVDYTGKVLPAFRAQIEEILRYLRQEITVDVSCAVETTGWKIDSNIPPELEVQKDLHKIDDADILIALIHNHVSAGVQCEVGYAVGCGKQVLLAMQNGGNLGYFNQGLVSAGLATLVVYDNAASLAKQLVTALRAQGRQ